MQWETSISPRTLLTPELIACVYVGTTTCGLFVTATRISRPRSLTPPARIRKGSWISPMSRLASSSIQTPDRLSWCALSHTSVMVRLMSFEVLFTVVKSIDRHNARSAALVGGL